MQHGPLTAAEESARIPVRDVIVRAHTLVQYAVAATTLAGIAVLLGVVLSKTFLLGSDSAHHYAHVWYISDQIYNHARLPLHVAYLESGDALAWPYALAPWLVAALARPLFGDWTVTALLVGGFLAYGGAALYARPALRDVRLLSLLYINTFLIEGLVSFQLAFIWSVALFFIFVASVDRRRWALAGALAVLTVSTHPFAGAVCVAAYAAYAVARDRAVALPLGAALTVAALVILPWALYLRTEPAAGTTATDDLVGTLRFIARYRGTLILLPFLLSACAPAFRLLYLPVAAAMALTFAGRLDNRDVNTYGLDGTSRPFYGEFIASPQFDRALTYRVLEPNDREDGAYQLIRSGAVLAQGFFDQSQFRRWWDSAAQYRCFLGAKRVDVVLLEADYPRKFNQNESALLDELAASGDVAVVYRDPRQRFTAYDVRAIRTDGARFGDCGL